MCPSPGWGLKRQEGGSVFSTVVRMSRILEPEFYWRFLGNYLHPLMNGYCTKSKLEWRGCQCQETCLTTMHSRALHSRNSSIFLVPSSMLPHPILLFFLVVVSRCATILGRSTNLLPPPRREFLLHNLGPPWRLHSGSSYLVHGSLGKCRGTGIENPLLTVLQTRLQRFPHPPEA
jgi:hypothetical protein